MQLSSGRINDACTSKITSAPCTSPEAILGLQLCGVHQCFSTAEPSSYRKNNLPGRGLTKVQNHWCTQESHKVSIQKSPPDSVQMNVPARPRVLCVHFTSVGTYSSSIVNEVRRARVMHEPHIDTYALMETNPRVAATLFVGTAHNESPAGRSVGSRQSVHCASSQFHLVSNMPHMWI
jgi:hypothetical protein